MSQGWIKLHRQLTEWRWYTDNNTKALFIHLLLLANHQEKEWKMAKISRGQVLTGRHILAKETGISEQNIRTSLKRLKSTSEITIKSTNKFSLITILNYEKYQGDSLKPTSSSTSYLTNNQPTTNQQLTTNNNGKKEKNDNNIHKAKIWKDGDTIQLKDCLAIRRFGEWVDATTHVKLDRGYYKELP